MFKPLHSYEETPADATSLKKEAYNLMTESNCNMVKFSALERTLLGAACDYTVSIYNTEQQKVQHHYTNMHQGPAK